jgi:glyoxylase-like metal-dependent hydrolase (beta-lactamase superfamily II)
MTTVPRDQHVLAERIRGDTLKEIGLSHGLSIEGVRVVLAREGRRQIDDLERRLRANVETGELDTLLIPGHGGPDFDLALAYMRWALRELHDRGIAVRVHYRNIQAGVIFGLELEPAEEAT